jgi:hypothetical protein
VLRAKRSMTASSSTDSPASPSRAGRNALSERMAEVGVAVNASVLECLTPCDSRIRLGSLAVVDLPHLVALKLYAGGRKSMVDVLELLDRNPDADRARIRDLCARFG